MSPKRVAVLGATGYGGGELLRLLLRDPSFEVSFATSRSQSGPVQRVHPNLAALGDLEFANPSFDEIAAHSDVVMGALPHGASADTLAPFVDAGVPVIDLSGDFRLRDPDVYRQWYGREHPRPDLLARAVYGAPELNADALRTAALIASPGCFATAINLALLPAARERLIAGTPVVVAMTGSSGSGAEPKAGTHHPTRAQTLRPYKVLRHQHTPEILQFWADAGSRLDALSFIPVSAPIVRGILACVSCDLSRELTADEVEDLFRSVYTGDGFVRVLTDREPECAAVAGTNVVEVRPRLGDDGRLHVTTSLDNLVKGGAGQGFESLCLRTGRDVWSPDCPLSAPGLWP